MHSTNLPQARGSWRKYLLSLTLVSATGMLGGCASMSNTDRGVLGGGALGAGTGAALGSLSGHTGAGAAIGGIVGAVSGGLIGNSVDESERRQEARLAALQHPPLSLQDVVSLAQQHVSDDVIITQIRNTGSVYNLNADQIIWLRQNGVSEFVIREMQATAGYPRRVYSATPVYVVEPPPPVSVGIGFGFGRRGCW